MVMYYLSILDTKGLDQCAEGVDSIWGHVLACFVLSTWLGLSQRKELQLGKCLHEIQLWGIFSVGDKVGLIPLRLAHTQPCLQNQLNYAGQSRHRVPHCNGLAHPCLCYYGQIHCVVQARCRTHSLEYYSQWGARATSVLIPWGPAFLITPSGGWVGRGNHPITHTTHSRSPLQQYFRSVSQCSIWART